MENYSCSVLRRFICFTRDGRPTSGFRMEEEFVVELEKKGRLRRRLVKIRRPWSKRKFVLKKQIWEYWDGDVLKGQLDVAKCKVKVLTSSEADDKPFPFQVEVAGGEAVILSAPSEIVRVITLQWLSYASVSPDFKAPFVFGSALTPVDVSSLTSGKIVDNNSIYDGELRNSKFWGKGLLFGIDGTIIDGNFVNGKMNGHCKVDSRPSNGCTFEGEYVMNVIEGYGEATFPNGDVYRGNYVHNKCHGQGGRYHKSGGYYEGNWMDGHKIGAGKMRMANGGIFFGMFIDSAATEGIWMYSSGEIHVGYFGHVMSDNSLRYFKHGLGRNYKPNGEILEGQWVDGDFELHDSGSMKDDVLEKVTKVYKDLETDHSNYEKLRAILYGPSNASTVEVQERIRAFHTAINAVALHSHSVAQDVIKAHEIVSHVANHVFTLIH